MPLDRAVHLRLGTAAVVPIMLAGLSLGLLAALVASTASARPAGASTRAHHATSSDPGGHGRRGRHHHAGTRERRGRPHHAGAHRTRAHDRPLYYVSLGDSYAIGYQPSPSPGATPGYTALVAHKTHMALANFGCAGATATSILRAVGCEAIAAGQGAESYPHLTQAAAAEQFIRHHKGEIGLITVSIGGNNVTHCAEVKGPISCVLSAIPAVQKHVTILARQLRRAAGPTVPIVGLTYPDVILGTWVYPPSHPDPSLATLSVTVFKHLLNPTLKKAYRAAGGRFVNVTRQAGGYVPLGQKASFPPYGSVPVAVGRVCTLTWYCTRGNIHATTAGYALIGKAIVARYRALTHGN